jgi:hypothetical protein
MQSKAATVDQYVKELEPQRAAVIQAVRKVILQNLGKGFQETMQYGMIGYNVPHSIYPAGYHCDPKQPLPYAALAAQKNAYSLYMSSVYGSEDERERFVKAWQKSGKKLDMGKSCIRFKSLDQIPLEVVGEAIKRVSVADHIKMYEAATKGMEKTKVAEKTAVKKTAVKKTVKTAVKKAAKKKAKK